ncbi:DUF1707 domain-containing protein [Actinomycetospora sp. TBRC 11914]|uniref:DUF1707 SHOCT-like domain-containing protein n=1 Tax=Actinomycetospora sp. TBRC 11914 TaxID=2729387 RepID=UPI00145C9709|nr:DUF1707 domain-containing protein [Actinomycetospora sp. TBRC 11914]NMO93426.1 DUF1707 domain-containing protein [Actinomycetospora sp. TBRC 11914]
MSVDGAVRCSDAERAQVADRLATAHAEGRLTLAEYDERVRAAHGAVVRDDLAPLTGDLPGRPAAPAVVGRSRTEPARRSRSCAFGGPFPGPFPVSAGGVRGAVAAWAVVSAVNLLIWLAVVLGSGAAVYPWWIWVAGPWGVALLVGALGRSAQRSATP